MSSSSTSSSSSRRVLWGALLLSVLLHVLLGVLWIRGGRETRAVAQNATSPIEVEVVLSEPEPLPEEPEPRPQAAPRPPRSPVPQAPPLVQAPEPAEPVEEPGDPPEDTRPTQSPDAPLALRDTPVNLRPGLHTPFSSLGEGERITSSTDAGVPHLATSADPDFVQHLVVGDLARARVKRGISHSYYGELGKALLKAWDAEKAVEARGLEGWLAQTGEKVQTIARAYVDKAREFAQSGALFDAPTKSRTVPSGPAGADGQLASLGARRQLKNVIRQDLRETRRAEVKVIQDGSGRLISVEIEKPSRDAKIDNQALADVRAAAENLPPPPPDAVGEDDRLVSIWSFELIVSISPPVPMVSVTFDEALGFFDARMPLDRRIYKRVQLVAFY